MRYQSSYHLLLSLAIALNEVAYSFTFTSHQRITGCPYKISTTFSPSYSPTQQQLREKNGDSEETYTYEDTASGSDNTPSPTSVPLVNELDNLTPPPINLSRGSILFSENPSTKRNNAVLDLWRSCKVNLPAVITGGWPWKDSDFADDNPIAGLYNIAFVRMPVIVVGFVYGKNLLEGHPLIMDIGDGPFVMSPLVVVAVLGLILA